MIEFSATLKKFDGNGEKTGWTYIEVKENFAQQLMPGNKKAFRVKGYLDHYFYEGISLVPMGGGDFIIALNATVRKKLGKGKGAVVIVKMEVDSKPIPLSADLMQCLADEPAALAYFSKLPGSHQKYYSNWIESAKTEQTKAIRIAQAVTACSRQMGYGEMIRSIKNEKNLLK